MGSVRVRVHVHVFLTVFLLFDSTALWAQAGQAISVFAVPFIFFHILSITYSICGHSVLHSLIINNAGEI